MLKKYQETLRVKNQFDFMYILQGKDKRKQETIHGKAQKVQTTTCHGYHTIKSFEL